MDQSEAAPEGDQLDESSPGEKSPRRTNNQTKQPLKKITVRKRTKTGCMTCRKRRIKCDEGKPTCSNCIKSKRECEGYSQRLTFKEPLGSYHHGGLFGHPANPQPAPEISPISQLPPPSQPPPSHGPLAPIAPKPPSADLPAGFPFQFGPTSSGSVPPHTLSPTQYSPQHGQSSSSFAPAFPTPTSPHAEIGAEEFFQIISAAGPPEGTTWFEQVSPIGERGQQPVFRDVRYAPPTGDARDISALKAAVQDRGYWHSDDEASMGESEDEEEEFGANQLAHLESNDLGIQVARRLDRPFDFYGTQLRTFTGFVDANNVLETYTPSSTNSPLNDTQTAAVFWYFVNVTGPSMSLYERHPFDPSPMFQGQPVPKARQHIWTYTFPIIAFNHPALLQAMLALGSLQMAKLQGIPATASMKHYHLSLRRIAKNYQSLGRRTQPATLAATLLLGFYEVWNSDHDKWCKHMWGARAILKEIPLRDMTKAVLSLKRKRRQRLRELRNQQRYDAFSFPAESVEEVVDMTDVDAGLMSQLTGMTVTYEDFDRGFEDEHRRAAKYTERDIENYEHWSDLFWWYCKMDVYQSILGGTRLFMEYDLWTQCAPRGPFGRIDAIFGTYDHLMLLLGRLASFASLDLARKRKAKKTAPPGKGPGMGRGQSPPMFPGLVPSSGRVTVPTGFSPPRETTPQSEGPDEMDLEESTTTALREWESIRQAFDIFRSNLSADFDPLGPEFGPPQHTPFGPAQTYRTFSIAGIWMNYYMGLIVLHRSHPSMPPVAMMAAGMAAQQTGMWANEIGRIAAGLTAEDCGNITGVSTLVGAAFIESCFCLFVAGVQYQNDAQRQWTIKRLHDIARLTGWQSARQIADGCESAWTKAAQFGRGPPYQRAPEVEQAAPASVWANPRRIDRIFKELDAGEQRFVLTKSEQAHYALGLLSMEQDLDRLELREGG